MAKGAIGDAARAQVQADWLRQPAALHALTPGPLVGYDRISDNDSDRRPDHDKTPARILDRESWARLVASRDNRPISLSE